MFLGHYAVGFAAKRFAPALSLGGLFFAAQFADLLWPNLLLFGAEKLAIEPGLTAVNPLKFVSYPWSHSLVALTAWAAIVALLFAAVHRRRGPEAFALGILVLSHWGLDVASHTPDMPLTIGGETRLGWGLWRSLPWTAAVEVGLLAVGAVVYLRATRARDRIGSWGLAGLVALLVAIYLGSLFGPPPPSPEAVAWSAQALWLLVFAGAWVDRHREPRSAVAS